MKQTIAIRSTLAVLLLVAGAALAQDTPAKVSVARPLKLGQVAPMKNVKMKSVDGSEVTLASAAGAKGTLVVFTCNACPWAKMWEQRVAEIGNEALGHGLGVVAINSNDPSVNDEDGYATMQERAKTLGVKFPYVVDGTSDVARAFGASRTPEVFLFDAKGKLVYHGAVDDNARDAAAVEKNYLKDAVHAVAAGKAVAVSDTKALGCTTKFRDKKAKSTT